jgi:hypothetical protein
VLGGTRFKCGRRIGLFAVLRIGLARNLDLLVMITSVISGHVGGDLVSPAQQ